MRGVVFLRLLVFLCFVSIITGISIINYNGEETSPHDNLDEPATGTINEESATESDGAPARADFSPDREETPVERHENYGPIMILIGGGVLSFLLVGSLFFEFVRVLCIVAFLTPLIVRKKHDNERNRGRVLGFIEANAGIHFTALRDGLGLANGVTSYHLQILEKEGSIISWRDGKLRRFAVSTIHPNDIDSIKSPLAGTRLAILQVLAQSGNLGLDGKVIRTKLKISRQLLSHHLRVLSNKGLIERIGSSKKAPWKISRDGIQALQVIA